MECFKIENLSFAYPDRDVYALHNVNITVNRGEFLTLCGRSGCGKTTLLRMLKPSLMPYGTISGSISFNGRNISECSLREQAAEIGFVMQSPDNQIVTDKVWHELAFGLESLGFSTPEIQAKVSEMASFFGIQNWFYKDVSELSGGQKQLLNLASVMVIEPSVLILDEPTSQLDPIAAQEFMQTLAKINRELGTTVILTEHRLEEAFALSDRVIVMENGEVIADDSPYNVGEILKNTDMYSALPTPVRVHGAVENKLECPLTVRDGRLWLSEYSKENELHPERIPQPINQVNSDTVIELKDVWFRYGKELSDVIKGMTLKINKGEVFALVGGNGTGKTTALSLISGLYKPYRGRININGKDVSKIKNLCGGVVGVLPQNPQTIFSENTVEEELKKMLDKTAEEYELIRNVCKMCEIGHLLKFHPYDLSGGEQQRVALAKILLLNPEILLLDEPTKGMDASFKENFAVILKSLKQSGKTIVMVSHDIEFCAEYADRCALVFDGDITSDGVPREFFAGNSFYTTAASRMARAELPSAVIADDIISACGGTRPQRKKPEKKSFMDIKPKNESEDTVKTERNHKFSPNTLFSLLMILIAVPLTVLFGVYFLDDRKYYFISLLIILETMLSFYTIFENRKPQARELVVISVLCGIAVASRAAFFMLPHFKPVTAVIIIAGICFGGETGFLVGAVTGFVSNFFFGQGPWTPWQMFALGIIGFLSGVIFKKGLLQKSRKVLCVFGFLATFLIYGGIMNPSSVIMTQSNPSLALIAASFISGAPLDLIHALSTAVFLYFISKPMIEKLESNKEIRIYWN